jgi:multidrug resistance efflux pump
MAQNTETVEPQSPPQTPASPAPLPASDRDLKWKRFSNRNPQFRMFLIIGVIVLVVAGFFLWRYFSSYEDTDDAQIDGHLNSVSARVSGHVTRLLVDDNQLVHVAQPLVEIDPTDYRVALDRAQADYANAIAVAEAARGECARRHRRRQTAICRCQRATGAGGSQQRQGAERSGAL